MAKGHPFITGIIGPVVACHIKATDRTIYRSRPSPYKQTAGTIAAQSTFAMASVAGRILRQGLNSILPFPKDKMMQSNFSGAINKWLKTGIVTGLQPVGAFTGLSNFAFNAACPFERRWNAGFEIVKNTQGVLILKIHSFIPSEKISAPAGTVSVECRIAAAGCMLKKGVESGQFETAFTFPFNNEAVPAREINMGIVSKRGSLVVCGAYLIFQLKGRGRLGVTDNVKFIPAGVVGVVQG